MYKKNNNKKKIEGMRSTHPQIRFKQLNCPPQQAILGQLATWHRKHTLFVVY
jgi:hypothetical protein